MIRKVSEFLKKFMDIESEKLRNYDISHPVTIGSMYEGLTRDILEKAFPIELNLDIREGFIHDGAGNMTGQIDCMLVTGHGEKIPYTESYKWHIKDVIAVFEIKKELFSSELVDSFDHLRSVKDAYHRYIQSLDSNSNETFPIDSILKTFEQITGIIAPQLDNIETYSQTHQLLYHTLVNELYSPIRIIIGYDGFKRESNFRKAMINFLSQKGSDRGFGVGSFPQLIISGNFSLIKLNGQPYATRMLDDFWDFYASSRNNPILLILEFIWTRLTQRYSIQLKWDEDLTIEKFTPFIAGKIVQKDDKIGWHYRYEEHSEKELSLENSEESWTPEFLTITQFVIVKLLCSGKIVSIDDAELKEMAERNDEDYNKMIKSLINTSLVCMDGNELKLTVENCVLAVFPDGRFAAAGDNTHRLAHYIKNNVNGASE